MSQVKFKGLFSLEILYCGCELRKYCNGMWVIDSQSSKCENKDHWNFKKFFCRITKCSLEFPTLPQLKKHMWDHAV